VEASGRVIPRSDRPDTRCDLLTAFESRALELFASGFDRNEIAQRLHRSPKTISNCLTLSKEKLGARSLAEAVALFTNTSLIRAQVGSLHEPFLYLPQKRQP